MPVELRHHQVEDDEVVAAGADLLFHPQRIAQCLDLVPVSLEQGLHVVANGAIVVDDQDTYCRKLDCHLLLLSGDRGLRPGPPRERSAASARWESPERRFQ